MSPSGPGGRADAVWSASLVILVLGVAEAGLVALRRQFVINPATTVETRMRVSLYGHLQDLTVSFHDRWGSGQLLSRAMTDLNFLRRWMAFGAIMLVVTTLTVVIGVVVMFSMSWQLALIFLAAAVPIMIYGFRFRTRYSKVARRSQDQAGDLATTVEESVHGIRRPQGLRPQPRGAGELQRTGRGAPPDRDRQGQAPGRLQPGGHPAARARPWRRARRRRPAGVHRSAEHRRPSSRSSPPPP